jgi:hypothetical protein
MTIVLLTAGVHLQGWENRVVRSLVTHYED